MKAGRMVAAVAAVAAVAGACNSYSSAVDVARDGGPSDAAPLGDDAADAGEAGTRCKGEAGPTPIAVGTYCIDATEVTGRQYREFLARSAGDAGPMPAACAWKTSFEVAAAGNDDYPASFVDWCDAFAYCAWAGKRLCGRVGGGASTPALSENPLMAEWQRACTHEGAHDFPYGDAYEAGACNVPFDGGPPGPQPAGTSPRCEGGYPGVFDMSGNVWEWEDACDDAGCMIRGGSYAAFNAGECGQRFDVPRDGGGINDVGIRCCSDLE